MKKVLLLGSTDTGWKETLKDLLNNQIVKAGIEPGKDDLKFEDPTAYDPEDKKDKDRLRRLKDWPDTIIFVVSPASASNFILETMEVVDLSNKEPEKLWFAFLNRERTNLRDMKYFNRPLRAAMDKVEETVKANKATVFDDLEGIASALFTELYTDSVEDANEPEPPEGPPSEKPVEE